MQSLHGPFCHVLLSRTHEESTWIDIDSQHTNLNVTKPYLNAFPTTLQLGMLLVS